MNAKTKLFVVLWLAGLAGVFSFLLVDLTALIAIMPIPAGTEIPTFTPVLKLLSLIQPAIILSVAVLVGVVLASKVGLSSPVAETAVSGGDLVSALKPQVVPGIVGGLAGGVGIVLIAALSKPFLPPEVLAKLDEFGKILPLLTRLLYGGITEELLSPDLSGDFEMIRSVFASGSSSDTIPARAAQDGGYLVSGSLNLWLGEEKFELKAGDSFSFQNQAYRWQNPGDEPAVAVWIISPPIY